MKHLLYLALAAASALAACTQLSPASLVQVARLNPLTTAPSGMTVAVGVPQNILLRSGDASVFLTYTTQDTSAAPSGVSLPLTLQSDTRLPMPTRQAEVFYVFGLTPEDAARFAETQAQITDLKAQGIEGTGAFGVTINGACFDAPLADVALASTWLKTSPDGDFTLLTPTIDLCEVLDLINDDTGTSGLIPC